MKTKGWKQAAAVLAVGALFAVTGYGAPASDRLSEKLFDFQVQINDEFYQFPMDYGEFLALGWEEANPQAGWEELEPDQYEKLCFQNGNMACRVYVKNFTAQSRPAEECRITGMEFDTFDWDPNLGSVILPGEIRRGKSTLEEIEAAYGEPDQIYDGEMYTKYVYAQDLYREVELSVYHESGVLEDIELVNLAASELENF